MRRPKGTEKRRFGVSVSSEVANTLDILARRLGVDRSSLIEKALRSFLHDHIHYIIPHECKGILILSGRFMHNELLAVIEKYKDIIHSYIHMHINDCCVELMVVSGESTRIAELHSSLESSMKGCRVRYIPLLQQIPNLPS